LKVLHHSCLLAAVFPLLARAQQNGAFLAPMPAAGRETLPLHGYFMLAMTVLFVVVFAITLYSLAKHRKGTGPQPGKVVEPGGTVQWLWATIPFAILLFIDYVLIGNHFNR
jgi:cytochrome c oxidase subunit 2